MAASPPVFTAFRSFFPPVGRIVVLARETTEAHIGGDKTPPRWSVIAGWEWIGSELDLELEVASAAVGVVAAVESNTVVKAHLQIIGEADTQAAADAEQVVAA